MRHERQRDMSRPVLLGMNNPISSRPEYALYPYPPGCTGHRLLRLLQRRLPGVGRREYLAAFDRRNLLHRLTWSRADARRAAEEFLEVQVPELLGRTVVVLGDQVRNLLGLEKMLIHPVESHGVTWRQLPHPSGRCLWYNDQHCAELAALLLEELYEQGRLT